MYTVTEVAKMFSVKVVKVYRIPKEEIDRLIDKQRKEDEGK